MSFGRGGAGGVQHTLLGGLEVGHQKIENRRLTGRFNGATRITVPASNPLATATSFSASASDANNQVSADIAALYVQDQVALGEQWKVLAGLRYDRFKVAFDDRRAANQDLARTDNEVSPRLGLVWQPTAASTYYASYSTSFLPSAETLSLAANTAQMAPESAINYEVGARWDLAPTLTLSAAAFRTDRDDVKSVEQTTQSAPAGRTVGLVPQHAAAVWNKVDFDAQWGAGLGVIYQSAMYTSFTNTVHLPSFTRVDGAVYYRFADGKTRLALNLEKLLDKRYYPTAHNDNNISTGAPRSAQLTLSTRF